MWGLLGHRPRGLGLKHPVARSAIAFCSTPHPNDISTPPRFCPSFLPLIQLLPLLSYASYLLQCLLQLLAPAPFPILPIHCSFPLLKLFHQLLAPVLCFQFLFPAPRINFLVRLYDPPSFSTTLLLLFAPRFTHQLLAPAFCSSFLLQLFTSAFYFSFLL